VNARDETCVRDARGCEYTCARLSRARCDGEPANSDVARVVVVAAVVRARARIRAPAPTKIAAPYNNLKTPDFVARVAGARGRP